MKKIISAILAVLTVFLCSCGRKPAMTEILSYQSGDFSAEVGGTGGLHGVFTKSGEEYSFELGTGAAEGIRYIMTDGVLYICSGNVKIMLNKEKTPKMTALFRCFRLDGDTVWQISEENTGGADVLRCVSQDAAAYFERRSYIPYRFEIDGYVFDILKFDVIKRQ